MPRQLIYYFKSQPEKINELVQFRLQGWSYSALAEKYGCPKLTIRSIVRRRGLGGNTVSVQFTRTDYFSTKIGPEKEVTTTSVLPQEEKISVGKTYAEYVKEDQERQRRRLTEREATPDMMTNVLP